MVVLLSLRLFREVWRLVLRGGRWPPRFAEKTTGIIIPVCTWQTPTPLLNTNDDFCNRWKILKNIFRCPFHAVAVYPLRFMVAFCVTVAKNPASAFTKLSDRHRSTKYRINRYSLLLHVITPYLWCHVTSLKKVYQFLTSILWLFGGIHVRFCWALLQSPIYISTERRTERR